MDKYEAQAMIRRIEDMLRPGREDYTDAADYEPVALEHLLSELDEGHLWLTTAEPWESYKQRVGEGNFVETFGGSENIKENHFNRLERVESLNSRDVRVLRQREDGEYEMLVGTRYMAGSRVQDGDLVDICASGPEGVTPDGRPYGAASALLRRLLEPLAAGLLG